MKKNGEKMSKSPLLRIVGEDGNVEFPCPTEAYPYIKGKGNLPATRYVEGREKFISYWSGHRSDCHSHLAKIGVGGLPHAYLAWRNLNDAIPIVIDSFGYSRHRLKWEVDPEARAPHYNPKDDKVVFPGTAYRRVTGHEYTHALHHKAMGGLWKADCINNRRSYTCAFQEGLAHYGGWVGVSDDTSEWSWEDPNRRSHPPDPKSEVSVAALFHDLIDGGTSGLDHPGEIAEPADKTQYSAHYVMDVFATCEVKYPRRFRRDWEKRNDVSDFVWCLENRVDTGYHGSIFPDIETPNDVKEKAVEPADWSPDSIRSTWLWNLCDTC